MREPMMALQGCTCCREKFLPLLSSVFGTPIKNRQSRGDAQASFFIAHGLDRPVWLLPVWRPSQGPRRPTGRASRAFAQSFGGYHEIRTND